MANKKDLVNCPHCGILVRNDRLKNHTLLKCPKVVGVKSISNSKLSPTLHFHKTIKHVTKATISSMPTGWLKNFNRSGEELRALYSGKKLPAKASVKSVMESPVNTPETVKPIPIVEPIQVVDAIKPAPVIASPTSTFFNKEAYQIAIRSMSTGEAWKLAHNEDLSEAFLEAHRANYALLDSAIPSYKVEAPVEPPAKPESVLEAYSVPVRGEKIEISTIGRDSAAQAAFRKAVSANYNHCCAITGDSITVEACHIQTHSDHYDNCVDNGIMLSVGLHRLFDTGIMVIDPDSMTVHFMQDCFYKKHLEGAPVRQGKIPINKNKLKAKNLYID